MGILSTYLRPREARLPTVRDPMALECVQDWHAVIATFAHPRYELS